MITEPRYELDLNSNLANIIKVIGVGGGGGNAVLNMWERGFTDIDFIACNTDAQALRQFPEEIIKMQLGAQLTKGLGAGTDSKIGQQAAIESEKAIMEVLADPTEMVFITAGMGGGTGTGAAPEIARIARSLGRLTVGVVTDPFKHEGIDKIEQAQEGIEKLKEHCDTVLLIKNDRLLDMYGDLDIDSAYIKADEVLGNAVRSIAELITRSGKVNLDFSDVKKVLEKAGQAVMGTAEASGPERATLAIEAALNSPLLENNNINGARKILMSIAYSDELPEYKIKMSDQGKVTDYIENKIKTRAKLFKHGFAIDRSLKDKIRVTVVAAQFDNTLVLPTEREARPTVGRGIDNFFPDKKVNQSGTAAQGSLFEQDDRLFTKINTMVKTGYDTYEMINVPAYQRFGAELSQINYDEDLNKIVLNELYEGLSKEMMI